MIVEHSEAGNIALIGHGHGVHVVGHVADDCASTALQVVRFHVAHERIKGFGGRLGERSAFNVAAPLHKDNALIGQGAHFGLHVPSLLAVKLISCYSIGRQISVRSWSAGVTEGLSR